MAQSTPDIPQILQNVGITELNDMQQSTLKAAAENDHIVLLSATGSGKTFGFLLPLLSKIKPELKANQAVIIAPSRELAQQIEKVFKSMGSGITSTCCYGGHKREIEENNLGDNPQVIIGTPGRLADHLRRQSIKPEHIQSLILDEFDKSLEFGFDEEMEFIANELYNVKYKFLVSATEAVDLPAFLVLDSPLVLDFLPEVVEESPKVYYRYVQSDAADKIDTLFTLLCSLGDRSTIIFCNHRESVERTSKLLREKGIYNEYYHGAMEQYERDVALCKFRNGTTRILVTTDIAARGLDIPNIRYIIHYQLPYTEDSFVHRNGRTARMEASGTVILLLAPDEELPAYAPEFTSEIVLDDKYPLPEKPKWVTLFINAGKKNKVNKIDIVGFLAQKGELKKEDIGLIEVKDFSSYVAIRKSKATHTLHLIKEERIKNKKVRIEIAK